MRTALGIAFGIATQLFFLVTVPALYRFLRNDFAENPGGALWIDALLAAQFCALHSLLLWIPVRRRLGRIISAPFFGAFYCVVTCMSLWLMFFLWRGSKTRILTLPPEFRPLVHGVFLLSWIALFYSLSLTGLGYQTGLTPWWYWLTGREPPARTFEPRGAYRWIRHPVYLSFLGLVWLTPVFTADRALLIAIWTAYIFAGSRLKDLRMSAYLGETYIDYRVSIPGFFPALRRLRPAASSLSASIDATELDEKSIPAVANR